MGRAGETPNLQSKIRSSTPAADRTSPPRHASTTIYIDALSTDLNASHARGRGYVKAAVALSGHKSLICLFECGSSVQSIMGATLIRRPIGTPAFSVFSAEFLVISGNSVSARFLRIQSRFFLAMGH